MKKVGFSTGCLYKTGMEIEEIIKLYYSLGANAIEISFGHLPELSNFNLTQEIIKDVKKYDFVTVHAPWDIRYGDNEKTKKIITKLEYLSKSLNAEGIVLHPDTVDSFSFLEKLGLPFLLENMDSRKKFGTHPDSFERLRKGYEFKFVLDVKHAEEHDCSMKLSRELLEVMGDRLNHFHVSGSDELNKHIPTYSAENRDFIAEILNLKKEVPRISEGIIFNNIEQTIAEELDFLKNI